MRMEFGINFINHGFKRASIKKILSTTKTKRSRPCGVV
jgi:hypothetical protein